MRTNFARLRTIAQLHKFGLGKHNPAHDFSYQKYAVN